MVIFLEEVENIALIPVVLDHVGLLPTIYSSPVIVCTLWIMLPSTSKNASLSSFLDAHPMNVVSRRMCSILVNGAFNDPAE